LDPKGQERFWNWVKEKGEGSGSYWPSTTWKEAALTQQLFLFKGGRLLEEGPPEQVLGPRGERLPWLMEVVYGEDAA
jgi:ABC-2 type transport system ATP-binding protein